MKNDPYKTYKGKAYRFLSFDGLFKTIESKKLRFTRVDCFNDPLDNSIFLAPWDWDSYARMGNKFITHVKELTQPNLTNSMFACCFCKEFNTEAAYLMWSHYANSHTQVCFEVDFSKFPFQASEITYPDSLKDERSKIQEKSAEEIGIYLATTKTKQWKYEKEVRILIDTLYAKSDTRIKMITDDNEHLYLDFSINHISKVIFGIKSNKQNEEKTIQMLTENNITPEYYKMVIDAPTLELKALKYPL